MISHWNMNTVAEAVMLYTAIFVALAGAALDYGMTDGTLPPASQGTMWDTDCPKACRCFIDTLPAIHDTFNPKDFQRQMKIINCTGAGFTAIPRNFPDETEVLILTGNNVTRLRKLPYITGLRYLDLSFNQIEKLYNYKLFYSFKELKYLSLRNNEINALLQGSFSGLLNLDHLDLGHNKISTIYRNAFAGLNHLKMLNMEGNAIQEIDSDWFEDMFNIQGLYMSHNLLTKIEASAFSASHDLIDLKLSGNNIASIDPNAFSGLHVLKLLDLSHNQLTSVPTKQLQAVETLGIFILDNNPIPKLQAETLSSMNITSLSISYMPSLVLMEENTFHNLPYLTTIQAHDNVQLVYIDSHAFNNVPRLRKLYLHNNLLSALSPQLELFLPSLDEIHLYHNPLRCDCNAFWLRDSIQTAKDTNYSKPFFVHPDKMRCDSPFNFTGVSLGNVPGDKFPRVCVPTSMPFFRSEYTFDLGEELRLECHGLGVPEPKIEWSLPNGTPLNDSVTNDKIEILNKCVLVIRHMDKADAGTYMCKAINDIGIDMSSTAVKVSNKPIRLVPYTVASDYISISWNGTQRSMISDYQLHYKQVGENIFNVIPLGPRYHSYTVTKLTPLTTYSFCIVYVFDDELYKIDCVNITTQKEGGYKSGITKMVNEKLVAGVCTAVGFLMAVVCIVTVIRKLRAKKDYEPPFEVDDGETVNIPLENVYQPLSTPICSSRTSLINSKSDNR